MQVPGGAFDSLSSNTQLGKAVQQACDELDTLVTLVRQTTEAFLPGIVTFYLTQDLCLCLHAMHFPIVAAGRYKALGCMSVQERQSLTDAQDMLKKLGYKGNILQADTPQEQSQAAAQIQQILDSTERERPSQE